MRPAPARRRHQPAAAVLARRRAGLDLPRSCRRAAGGGRVARTGHAASRPAPGGRSERRGPHAPPRGGARRQPGSHRLGPPAHSRGPRAGASHRRWGGGADPGRRRGWSRGRPASRQRERRTPATAARRPRAADRPAPRPARQPRLWRTCSPTCRGQGTGSASRGGAAGGNPAPPSGDVPMRLLAISSGSLIVLGVVVAIAYVAVLAIAVAFNVVRDARRRSHSWIFAIFAFLLAFLPPFLGAIIYMVIRPPRPLDEERAMAAEAQILAAPPVVEKGGRPCPTCGRDIEEDFVMCPYRRTRFARRCTACEHRSEE